MDEADKSLLISVIVCTRNRYEGLRACLKNIGNSSYPQRELIVVDSSDQPIRRENEKLVKGLGSTYCYEPKRRLAVARNTGIKVASGEVVVFADDDFIVDKNWIETLVPNYREPEVACCTGRMLSYRRDEASQLYERSMSFDRGDKRRVFGRRDISIRKLLKVIPSIGNKKLLNRTPAPWAVGYGFCSFRRSIFNSIGYFDEELAVGTLSTGEDIDMFYRILKAGHKIVYEPSAIIYHSHPQRLEDVVKAAYTNGWEKRVFFSKYRKDIYMLFCFLGSLVLLGSAWAKSFFSSDRDFKKVILAELSGFLAGAPKT